MMAVITLLTIVTLSILVTRVATIALTHTGLSRESARFQARSAFTGSGFTTSESEMVVNHPVRRRIVLVLMLLGNAGFVTAVTSLILTFVHDQGPLSGPVKLAFLVVGLTTLWMLSMSPWVDRHLSRVITAALKRYTRLDLKDYAGLMQLAGEYRIAELHVNADDWVANLTLAHAKLRDEGVMVLGVKRRDGTYLGAPGGTTQILPEDNLIVYGRASAIEALDRRQKDARAALQHQRAVLAQQAAAKDEEWAKPQ